MLLGSIAALATAPLPADAMISVEIVNGLCIVPVLLDGRLARMVLDTGAERTVVTAEAAARLRLRRDLWVDTPMVGAGGLVERHPNVDVGAASAGGLALFQNLPRVPLSLAVTDIALDGADGLLGADLLRHTTLDLDVRNAKLSLLPARQPIPDSATVPLRPWARGLLLAPVRLDGLELVALLDTGSMATLINARGLYKLGITPARAAGDPVVPAGGLGGSFAARRHQFASLEIGGMTVPGPILLSAPVPEAAFDLILGLDVLGRQRLLLSYLLLRLAFSQS